MIDETFWSVQFKGTTELSAGVVIFTKGKIFGGDGGHTFMGNYNGDPNVKGSISVHPFVSGFKATGMHGDYELEFSGTVEEKTVTATASVVGHKGNKLTARLTKVADLPSVRSEWAAAP